VITNCLQITVAGFLSVLCFSIIHFTGKGNIQIIKLFNHKFLNIYNLQIKCELSSPFSRKKNVWSNIYDLQIKTNYLFEYNLILIICCIPIFKNFIIKLKLLFCGELRLVVSTHFYTEWRFVTAVHSTHK